MGKEEEIWPVIVRYLDKSIDEQESNTLEEWLDKSAENRRILHAIDRIWKSTEERPQDSLINQLNLERDWDKIADRIQSPGKEKKEARIRRFKKLRKRQQILSNLLKAAALVLVAFTSAFLTLQYAPQPAEQYAEPVFNEIGTNAGERANVELGDGTKVMLNAASKLIVPESFSSDKREVELNGQAYFDVKSDPKRPFYIQTDNAVVEVIGTSFDVRAYDDENEMMVTVREGTVELTKKDDPGSRVIVNEGYKGSFSIADGYLSVDIFRDPEFYFGWMDGRLIFKNTPISDVFKHLERWYDVTIEFDEAEEDLLRKEFTADLKTRSIREVLSVMQMSLNIEFTMENDDVVVISKKA
jgi:transmembrane sensor